MISNRDSSPLPSNSPLAPDGPDAVTTQMQRTAGIHNAGIFALASVFPALYLLYVIHFSVNVPTGDDWSVIPIVHATLHGQLTLGMLWAQHNETRLFLPYLIFAVSALVDHYNTQSLVFLSAVLFIGSYILFLAIFRSYSRRPLTVLPVLTIGLVWFSLEDYGNSLWDFQLAWYLVVFFLMVMTYLLLQPRSHRNLFFVLAIVAAIAGSSSSIEGFFLWPIGILCLLWELPQEKKRRIIECSVWLVVGGGFAAVYFAGFRTGLGLAAQPWTTCVAVVGHCAPGYALQNPGSVVAYFLAVLGNVIPTGHYIEGLQLGFHELLGAILCVTAAFVVIQCVRERQSRNPLPAVAILFAAMFAATISIGRIGEGIGSAVYSDRFTMPGVLLLVGVVAYACGHVPDPFRLPTPSDRRGIVRVVGLGVLVGFVLIQFVVSAHYGVVNARDAQATDNLEARVAVNVDRVPIPERGCYLTSEISKGLASPAATAKIVLPLIQEMRTDRLSEFRPWQYAAYRDEGLPSVPGC